MEKSIDLFSKAISNKWQEGAETYDKDKNVRFAKMPGTGNTLLHVAVLSGNQENVKLLMKSLDKGDPDTLHILAMKNKMEEDTPLHLAAAMGMEEVCSLMTKLSPRLVMDACNKRGETPLFKAVRHGHKYAFFALQSAIESLQLPPQSLSDEPSDVSLSVCKREREDTILHNAIFGEHFDLALEIIKLYPGLVNSKTEKKELPLHVLARKPFVFKSGMHFNMLDNILYYCTPVDRFKVEYPKYKEKIKKNLIGKKKYQQNVPSSLRSFFNRKESSAAAEDDPDGGKADQRNSGSQDKRRFPKIYDTFSNFFKLAMKGLLIIVVIGESRIHKIKKTKRQNTDACQVLKELVDNYIYEEPRYGADGLMKDEKMEGRTFSVDQPANVAEDGLKETRSDPDDRKHIASVLKMLEDYLDKQLKDDSKPKFEPVTVTPILVAAKRGVSEVVEKLLEKIPLAASDLDGGEKNFVLQAVEHRQSRIYELALKRREMNHIASVDRDGNSALHLAAKLSGGHPLAVPGEALRMQWEVKWYKYVEDSVDHQFFQIHNNADETAREIFIKEHRELSGKAHEWLTKTSDSCSVVAALIATVAFTTATTLPGGVNQDSGFPILEGHPAFKIFAISALAALCFSVLALVTFLSFVTSRYDVWDFDVELPLKLIVNLTSLFLSIGAMLVSFCASHFFVMEKELKNATYVYPMYAAVCLPVSLFAMTQFSLYVDLIKATFARVPESAQEF